MLKKKLALQATLFGAQIFSRHDIGICRDHSKYTHLLKPNTMWACYFAFPIINIQKTGNNLK